MGTSLNKGNMSEKGEARLNLVGNRLSHWVGLWCEKFNPLTPTMWVGLRVHPT